MGLWSKGVDRSLSGELRREESMSGMIACVISFLYRFFGEKSRGKVELHDDILYIRIGEYGSRAKLKTRSHLGIMECLLECVDNILIHTRDVNSFFILRDKIIQNLTLYGQTHVLKDLYY